MKRRRERGRLRQMSDAQKLLGEATLTPSARTRIERILSPRNKMLSLKFRASDIKRWDECAAAEHTSRTDLIEKAVNAYCDQRGR